MYQRVSGNKGWSERAGNLNSGWSMLLIVVLIGLVLLVAPLDRVLGDVSRLVYLHGAMVWVAMLAFTAAALLGVGHLVTGRAPWQRWSQGVERAAIVLWAGYLPLSVIAADLAWNGVFWAEPRWRMAAQVLIVAVAFQVGAYLIENPQLASALNIVVGGALWWLLLRTPLVIHPDNPIGASDSAGIQLAFAALVGLCALAAFQLARWLKPAAAATTATDA
jgi:hypothetical protein